MGPPGSRLLLPVPGRGPTGCVVYPGGPCAPPPPAPVFSALYVPPPVYVPPPPVYVPPPVVVAPRPYWGPRPAYRPYYRPYYRY